MIVCISEDRRTHEVAVQLLLCSLHNSNSGLKAIVFVPDPSSSFSEWIAAYPDFQLRSGQPQNKMGWSIKPTLLLRLLDEGFEEVLWLDSDMLINGSLERLVALANKEVLVVAEEALAGQFRRDNDALRGRAWGLNVGRKLEGVTNTCILRVTSCHRPLLQSWLALMEQTNYLSAQNLKFGRRPIHLAGDQDVLTAILTSEEFKKIPIRYIKRGSQILQYYGFYGFTVFERCRYLFGFRPILIHSQGSAPWAHPINPTMGPKHFLLATLSDASPYIISAGRLSHLISNDVSWLKARTPVGRVIRFLGFGSIPLTGLPISAAMDIIRFVVRVRRARS